MKIKILTPSGETVRGELTADHSASSYNRPVAVDADGVAYGSAECVILSNNPRADDYAKRGGYSTARPSKLAAARIDKGMTIEELAARSGVSTPTINALEWRKQSPIISTLEKFAHCLDVTVADLID